MLTWDLGERFIMDTLSFRSFFFGFFWHHVVYWLKTWSMVFNMVLANYDNLVICFTVWHVINDECTFLLFNKTVGWFPFRVSQDEIGFSSFSSVFDKSLITVHAVCLKLNISELNWQ